MSRWRGLLGSSAVPLWVVAAYVATALGVETVTGDGPELIAKLPIVGMLVVALRFGVRRPGGE